MCSGSHCTSAVRGRSAGAVWGDLALRRIRFLGLLIRAGFFLDWACLVLIHNPTCGELALERDKAR
jgi:hypothetical protein